MSERYSRLFALTEDLYGEGAPVVIAAGALLKDNQNGKVLAQLKFRSLSGKRIKALTVALTPKDVAGAELEQVTHRYLDLDAGRDAEFCQKMPVFLPNAETRSFGAAVTQVVFADGSVWETENLHWEPLLKPESAAKVGDAELAKQYRMEYGSYLMQEHKDLWFCSCGAVNRLGVDTTCHSCRKALADLQSISWEELEEHKQARLAEEEKARLAAEAEAEKNRAAAEARAKKMKKLAPIVLPILAVVIVAAVLITGAVKKKAVYEDAMTMVDQGQYGKAVTILKEAGYDDAADLVFGPIYQEAEALMEAGDYEAAAAAYKKISVYLDSHARAAEAAELAREAAAQPLYKEAEALLAQGETARAAMAFYAVGDYQDARKRSFELWSSLRHNPTVATGLSGTAAVTEDGKVLYWGDIEYPEEKQIMISADQWSDIESLSAGGFHLVGLRADGTVVAAGGNEDGQCNVSAWHDIVSVSAGGRHTVGLKADGTVVAVGLNRQAQCEVSGWTDIVAVSAGMIHTVGLKKDGTVVSTSITSEYKDSDYGQCNVSGWKDIVAISSTWEHTVGLKADGTVVAVGQNDYKQCDLSNQKDIVAVAAGGEHTLLLKADGHTVSLGDTPTGVGSANGWSGIVDIFAFNDNLGLTKDGSLRTAGLFYGQESTVNSWTNIKLPKAR